MWTKTYFHLLLTFVGALLCGNAIAHTQTSNQSGAMRVYESPDSAPTKASKTMPHVEPIPLPQMDPSSLQGRKTSYKFKLSGSDWLDTGVVVTAGDQLDFSADGEIHLSDGRKVTAEGGARGWKDLLRKFPTTQGGPGALIGRIGEKDLAVPFLIGNKKNIEVTQSGHLFLAINSAEDLEPDGTYEVSVKLSAPKISKDSLKAQSKISPLELPAQLTPRLFSDLPRRVSDKEGHPGDMINFALVGSIDQIKSAFQTAGWVAVDKNPTEAVIHGLIATLSREAYVEMPMSTLYLFDRPQDLSFARASPIEVAAVRHHLRVWKSTKQLGGKELWLGSATHDNGFEKDQRTGGITHHIDPKIDGERDFLSKNFAAAGVLSEAAYVLPDNPLLGAKTATGGSFESDGRIVVLFLK